ncbi:MAG: sodium:solute symporter family protein, partial [Gemmatimonadetes bacterium]|nr:sodium:solute symporter family protein [Gemmatimonadota bacterium]
MSSIDLGIAALYVAGILGVGFAVSRRITGFRDYMLAGEAMSAPVLVCTLVSTYYGLDVLFGNSEVGFLEGVVGWFFYTRPYYLAVVLAALLVARRIRGRDFISLPDVAGRAYGRGTQATIALASFVYSLPLLALMGIGVLLDVVLGVPFAWGVVIGAVLSIAYTLMGGLTADAITDTVQFFLMCVTLGVAAALALDGVGGVESLRTALPASYFDPRGTYPLAVLLVWSLGALSVLVEPAFYQRILAARSHRTILAALAMGVVLWAAFDWISTLLGMVAQARGLVAEPRYALLTLTIEVLPVGLTGLFVAGVIATAMSTIDSYLLIAGGNLSYDLYRPLRRPGIGDAQLLTLTRWMIVVAGIVSVGFALVFPTIVSAWVFMASVLVSAALVPIMAALYLPPSWTRPAAGLAASWAGLAACLAVYAVVAVMGADDPEWGTRIWRFTLRGA